MTGIVMLSPELDGKRLQMLHEAFPSRRRIAVLYFPISRTSPNVLTIRAMAERLGLEVVPFYAAGHEEYEAAFSAISSAGADAVAIASAPVFTADAARLAALAVKAGLPTICEWREMTEKGCLIGYGPKIPDLRRRTAVFVARILRGTPAGELPIEDPTAFELTVNLKTAKALGLDIPVAILARADEVIE